jgi:glucokinase
MHVGIDLGATNIRVGLVDDRELVDVRQAPTPTDGSEEAVLEQICALLDRMPLEQVASIGAGVPSVVDVDDGIVYDVVNIPSWEDVPLGPVLEDRYGVPAFIQNDANCFALAAYHFGAGGNRSPMVGLIVGTGFAGGIIIDGELFAGRNCGAGEFGTAPYRDSIYEHYCAGLFFEREYGLTGAEAYERATSGDKDARAMFEEMGTHLGRAIKSVLYAVDPAHIVMGGSVRRAYPLFREAMWKEINTFAFSRGLDRLQFDVSELEHAGILGAAALTF